MEELFLVKKAGTMITKVNWKAQYKNDTDICTILKVLTMISCSTDPIT